MGRKKSSKPRKKIEKPNCSLDDISEREFVIEKLKDEYKRAFKNCSQDEIFNLQIVKKSFDKVAASWSGTDIFNQIRIRKTLCHLSYLSYMDGSYEYFNKCKKCKYKCISLQCLFFQMCCLNIAKK